MELEASDRICGLSTFASICMFVHYAVCILLQLTCFTMQGYYSHPNVWKIGTQASARTGRRPYSTNTTHSDTMMQVTVQYRVPRNLLLQFLISSVEYMKTVKTTEGS